MNHYEQVIFVTFVQTNKRHLKREKPERTNYITIRQSHVFIWTYVPMQGMTYANIPIQIKYFLFPVEKRSEEVIN